MCEFVCEIMCESLPLLVCVLCRLVCASFTQIKLCELDLFSEVGQFFQAFIVN